MRPIDETAPAAGPGVPPELRAELERVYTRAAQLRSRRRAVWPATGVALFVALVLGFALVGPLGRSSAPAPAAGYPATFVALEAPASTPGEKGSVPIPSIVIVSTATGNVVRNLGEKGLLAGVGLSPDGRTLYVGANTVGGPAIYAAPSLGGPSRLVARGYDPAVSPNGRYLAFWSNTGQRAGTSGDLGVLDLETGRTRIFDLTSELGSAPVWIGDSDQVGVLDTVTGCTGAEPCPTPAAIRLGVEDLDGPKGSPPAWQQVEVPGEWQGTTAASGPRAGTVVLSVPTDQAGDKALFVLVDTNGVSRSGFGVSPLPGWHGTGLGPVRSPLLSVSADGRWGLAGVLGGRKLQVVDLTAGATVVRTLTVGTAGEDVTGAAW